LISSQALGEHFPFSTASIIYILINDMFTIFLQQIISGRLLLVVIVGAKK